ncbi:MAG: helix-turn-helix transcriptional regulator [Oscillibacter sp.]|nr:helix-turn-helix transcriptional regulator [Oscillibacter sp.]
MKDILAKRLKKCRKQTGLPQIKVAIYCDITEKAYQNYELGVHEPKVSILMRIAQFYGVSIDYLVGLTDDPAPYPRAQEQKDLP